MMTITISEIAVPMPVETGYDTCRMSKFGDEFRIESLSREGPLFDEYIRVPFLEVSDDIEFLVNIADIAFCKLREIKEKLKSVGIELNEERV